MQSTILPSGVKITGTQQVGPDTRLNPEQHEKLVQHIHSLIRSSSKDRADRITTMRATEMDLLGVAEPDGSDCERDQKRREGRGAATVDRIYPFGYLRMQKYAADLTAVIMPYEAPYATVAGVDQQDKGDAIAKSLRYSAALFDHRNHVHAAVFDALSLNLFALRVDWRKHGYAGSVNNLSKGARIEEIHGPAIAHLDPYNIAFDSSVEPAEVAEHGEFFCEFDLTSKFQLRRMRAEGQAYFTADQLAAMTTMPESTSGLGRGTSQQYYYDARLRRARDETTARGSRTDQTDFRGLLGANSWEIVGDYVARGIQVTKMLIRIEPYEYGLANRIQGSGMQIYEVVMVGEGLIVYAQPAAEAGGRFNIALGTMSFDRRLGRDLSHGAAVSDLSAFASTILNTYKHSRRKGLEGGVTLYNPKVVPLHKLDDMSGGRLPVTEMHGDGNIGNHVLQLNDVPDVKNSLQDAQSILGLLENLLPSSSRPEMAGLDRATEFQAQAVAMTSDRELMYHAVMFDGQAMTPIRWLMQFFVMNNADSMTYVDEKTRQLLTLSAQDIQSTSFALTQPAELIGVDRLRVSNMLSGLINMTLQAGNQMSPLTMSLIKHFIDISGIPVDLSEYQEIAAQMQQQQQRQQQADLAAQEAAAGAPPQGQPTPQG